MRKFWKRLVVSGGILALSSSMTLAAGEVQQPDSKVTVDQNQLRELIKDVIKENPKLIYETINTYVREMNKDKQEKQLESGFKNRITGIAVDENMPARGPKDAPILLVEYTDFQCPYCAKASKTVEDVLKKYPQQVRLVLKNNPLDFHEQAVPAAKAALAAHKQGKFWEYHDLLFANSSKLNEEMFVKFAKDLSLDMEKFAKDRNSDDIAVQIEADKEETAKNKLKGTPAFVANGVVIRGAQTLDYFVKVIDRLLAEKNKPEEKKPEPVGKPEKDKKTEER